MKQRSQNRRGHVAEAASFCRPTLAASATRRRGSTYAAVMGTALIVSLIGFAAANVAQVRMRASQSRNDVRRARVLAQAGVARAIAVLNNDPSWRSNHTSNVKTTPLNFGGGTTTYKLVDDDGNLADDPTDRVWIYGYGRVGNAVWVEKARARIDGGLPLECLRCALHCKGGLTVTSGLQHTLTPVGAPASTDNLLTVDGTLDGNAEAVANAGSGSITGTVLVPAAKKGMPLRALFTQYKSRATQLTYSGNLQGVILGPQLNDYDGTGTNADGLYFLNTGGSDVTLNNLRLIGTLVIDAGNGTVTIQTVNMAPQREDFPVLIIKGNVVVSQSALELSEVTALKNFNPAAAPYNNQSDADLLDTYPNRITGLVHVIGQLQVTSLGGNFKGAVVVDGSTVIDGPARIEHDPALMPDPPIGYTADPASVKMVLTRDDWSRTAAP